MTTQTTTPAEVAPYAPGIRMHHATRAKAGRLAAALAAEYPRIAIVARHDEEADEDYLGTLTGFALVLADEEENEEAEAIAEFAKVPELADVLDACLAAEVDPQGEEEDEDEARSGSVVPEVYRARYRETSSNGQTCGDWLAEQLVADTTGPEGKLIVDDLTAIFEANGLDMRAKWAMMRFSGSRGWEGRYRMSGRVVLEKVVVFTGEYRTPTGTQTPPADWIAAMETKHEKWLAKARKQQAAAEATAGKVEGEANDQADGEPVQITQTDEGPVITPVA